MIYEVLDKPARPYLASRPDALSGAPSSGVVPQSDSQQAS